MAIEQLTSAEMRENAIEPVKDLEENRRTWSAEDLILFLEKNYTLTGYKNLCRPMIKIAKSILV